VNKDKPFGLLLVLFACLNAPPASGAAPATAPETNVGETEAAASDTHSAEPPSSALEERIAELEGKLSVISKELEDESLARMIRDAEMEARTAESEKPPEEREFLAGSLALQKLNPEITFCSDILANVVINDGRFYAGESDRSGMPIRGIGLHFQHVLDPYSMFKSAFHFSPDHGVGIEEVYVSWMGLIPSTSFSVGRFRQNFGVLNRWHEHDLDQIEHPLAMRLVLGDEGLVGNGIMAKWLMPSLWAHANELTLEVVDGSNETLFAGEHFSIPSTMLHLKNYYDLSPSTYFELGLTGMVGFNNKRGYTTNGERLIDEPWRRTLVAGVDMTLYWSPPQRAKYRSLTWRSELYYAKKELPESGNQSSWGLYSYLQYQLSPRWFVGVRGDAALPTERSDDSVAWGIAPYVTLWQSEFVYLRLEYQHGRNIPYVAPDDMLARRTDNRLLLQLDFAAGPHKHEKY
jgi:hypothetical protein